MGKYMRKHKTAPLDASSGVSTRAVQSSPSHTLDFLELRSRSLHKPPLLFKHKHRFCGASQAENQCCRSEEDMTCVDRKTHAIEFRRNSESDDRIKTADDVTTPGSPTKHHPSPDSNNNPPRFQNPYMPTCDEMEDFFATFEKQEQRSFVDKYNFDIVNDLPLPGRFEWVKIRP